MSLSKALREMLVKGRPSLAGQLAAVQAQAGSGRKAAKLAGVSEATWRRWKLGTTQPKPAGLAGLAAAFGALPAKVQRMASIDQAAAARLRNGNITLNVEQNGGKEHGRDRKITGAGLRLRQDTGDKVIDRIIAGDDRGAARAFIDGIQDDFYHDWFEFDEFPDDADGDDGYGLTAYSAA